jgi:hypothetical protein
MVSTTKDGMLGVSGKERVGLAEHHLQRKNHRLREVLSRRHETPGVFFEQTQEPIFLFSRKMFPDQEISIRIVAITEVGHIPGNEEGYGEEKNTDKAPAFHLPYLFRGFKPAALCTTYPFFAFR